MRPRGLKLSIPKGLRLWRLRTLLFLIGPGFISACSGLEITNIGVFTYIGSAYGYRLFWSILLSAAMLAFLQQLASIVAVELGGFRGLRSIRYYSLFVAGLVLANIATLTANIVGVSIILSSMLHVNWVYVAVLVSTIVYSLSVSAKSYSEVNRILTFLTLLLGSYIVLTIIYIYENPNTLYDIITQTFSITPINYGNIGLDIIAVFGAAAAPYALVLEMITLPNNRDLREEFASIGLGLVFTTLASISIGLLAAVTLYPRGIIAQGPEDLMEVLGMLGVFARPLFVLGVTASSILAIMAILVVNTYLFYEYRRGENWSSNIEVVLRSPIHRETSLISVLVSIIGLLVLVVLYGSSYDNLVDIIRYLSIIINLTAWIPSFFIVYLYRYTSYYSRITALIAYIVVGVLIMVNVLGLLW